MGESNALEKRILAAIQRLEPAPGCFVPIADIGGAVPELTVAALFELSRAGRVVLAEYEGVWPPAHPEQLLVDVPGGANAGGRSFIGVARARPEA